MQCQFCENIGVPCEECQKFFCKNHGYYACSEEGAEIAVCNQCKEAAFEEAASTIEHEEIEIFYEMESAEEYAGDRPPPNDLGVIDWAKIYNSEDCPF